MLRPSREVAVRYASGSWAIHTRKSFTLAWARHFTAVSQRVWTEWSDFFRCLRKRYETQTAQQGARANAGACHESCCWPAILESASRHASRQAPAWLILGV